MWRRLLAVGNSSPFHIERASWESASGWKLAVDHAWFILPNTIPRLPSNKSILNSTCPLPLPGEHHHHFYGFLLDGTPLAVSPPVQLALAAHIMAIASRIFSLPGLTIAGAVEYLVIVKLLPDYFGLQVGFTAIVGTILVNYVLGIVFWALLYPNVFSPLRRIPGPKVSEPRKDLFPGNAHQILCRQSSALLIGPSSSKKDLLETCSLT